MARSWVVTAELAAAGAPIDALVGLLDALEDAEPSGAMAGSTISVTFGIAADEADDAARAGFRRLEAARRTAHLGEAPVVALSVALAETGRATPDRPDLVGREEVAGLCDLSPTQARELMDNPRFPEPIARLAQGPVWDRRHIERYLDRMAAAAG